MQIQNIRLNLVCSALFLSGLFGCANPGQSADSAQESQLAVNAVLDTLHAQAAAANFDAYFALYADNAVFLGTDRSEYWPLEDFKAYAKPHFTAGNGWTYEPLNRQLHFAGDTAWFEEELLSQNYGRVRGTGVLVREIRSSGQSVWKVAQYNLTLPIPNSIFGDIAKEIKAYYKAAPTNPAPPSQ